jgi:hypothetical protein
MKNKFLHAFMIMLPTFSLKFVSVKGKDIIGSEGRPFLVMDHLGLTPKVFISLDHMMYRQK